MHPSIRPRQSIHEAASEFLGKKRIAVTGVSGNPRGHGSNVVYQRLRERGYDVFAVTRMRTMSRAMPAIPT